jgi:hypothetical protein
LSIVFSESQVYLGQMLWIRTQACLAFLSWHFRGNRAN